MKTHHLTLLAVSIILFLAQTNSLHAQSGSQSANEAARYHEFDFWIGEWEVFKHGTDTLVGYSSIQSINDSTGILENYRSAQGRYKGKSLNTYNRETGNWEQYWIDNSGLVLKLQGSYTNGKMILLGCDGLVGNKISWEATGREVRQTWENTSDGGKTWTVLFDGDYRRKSD